MFYADLTIETLSTTKTAITGVGVRRLRYYTDIVLTELPNQFTTQMVQKVIRKHREQWEMGSGMSLPDLRDSYQSINSMLDRLRAVVIPINEELTQHGFNRTYRKVH